MNKDKIDWENLGFGRYFTPHIFNTDYYDDKWNNPRIEPYGEMKLEPTNVALHYGQSVFEGMKAYKCENGNINIFRPKDHLKRMNKSLMRLSMPEIDVNNTLDSLIELIKLNKDYVPDEPGALYIRPFMFATDNYLGSNISKTYRFMIILSPVGPYFPNGFAPIKLWAETNFKRAIPGGAGEAKAAGNYAPCLLPIKNAKDKGYDGIVFIDNNGYVQECNAMNIFFIKDNKLYVPRLDGSILHGITRDSIKQLWRETNGCDSLVLDKFRIDEFVHFIPDEIFVTGTAASIVPVNEINYNGHIIKPKYEIGGHTRILYKKLRSIQYGRTDKPEWTVVINK